jgi:hypothetical protein
MFIHAEPLAKDLEAALLQRLRQIHSEFDVIIALDQFFGVWIHTRILKQRNSKAIQFPMMDI